MITNGFGMQIARQLMLQHMEQPSVTDNIGLTLALIGKELDGTASTLGLGPRFQHHPPNIGIVDPVCQDGSI